MAHCCPLTLSCVRLLSTTVSKKELFKISFFMFLDRNCVHFKNTWIPLIGLLVLPLLPIVPLFQMMTTIFFSTLLSPACHYFAHAHCTAATLTDLWVTLKSYTFVVWRLRDWQLWTLNFEGWKNCCTIIWSFLVQTFDI